MSCPSGTIRRASYKRHSYKRKSRNSNKKVSVKKSYVSSSCIQDRGAPGRGKKILPKPGDDVHLSKYGYNVDDVESHRRKALLAAADKYGMLTVYRRLNLLANYQKNNKQTYYTMVADKEFLKEKYKKNSRKTSRKTSRRTSKK